MNDDWMNGFGKKAGCHSGNPVVFTIGEVTVYAGGHSRDGGWHRMSPLPDLALGPAQVMDRGDATTVPDGFTCRDGIGKSSHMISIDWPDFGIPQDVGGGFWLALVDDIKRLGIKSVSTQCVGGHGRTGVQLAILGYLMGDAECLKQPNAHALIKYVRSIYCDHAVETGKQQEYVAQCCGIPVGDTLFVPMKKSKSKFTYADESNFKPKKGNPSTKYFDEDDFAHDDADDDADADGDGFPTTWELYACEMCSHTQWVHKADKMPDACDDCATPNPPTLLLATSGLYEMIDICPKCDNTLSPFGKHGDVCIACAAEEAGSTVSNGEVKCKCCRKLRLPEFIKVL